MRRWVAVVMVLIGSAWLDARPATAGNPSFDCDKASHPLERLICQDDELSALDVRVAKAFANAIARAPANEVANLRKQQKAWRKALLSCAKKDGSRACAMAAYESRLADL